MAQENEFAEMTLARLIALEFLVRGLYAKWAIESPDPRGSNRRMLEGMIQSMWNLAPPKDDTERRLYENIETALREFQQNVDLRLSEEGFSE